jgi:hypothetical protein
VTRRILSQAARTVVFQLEQREINLASRRWLAREMSALG